MTDQIPHYRVTSRSFFQPTIVEAGSEILWEGPPNQACVPLNDAAKAKMEEYLKLRPGLIGVESLEVAAPAPTIVKRPEPDQPTINAPGIIRPEVAPTDGGKILEDLKPKSIPGTNPDDKGGDSIGKDQQGVVTERNEDDVKPAQVVFEAPKKKS